MKNKYIIFMSNEDDVEKSLMFESTLSHKEMATMVINTMPRAIIKSAGFWSIKRDGTISCYGESVSLNIKSRDIDSIIINLRYE